ncbi:MAG: AAA family ATPase [Desulfomonilaceae bacterium]
MPIDEISVKGVRGIRKEITVALNGKSLLIHGDNGTGKSSIEKALRWALLGTEAPTDAEPFSDEGSYRRHVLEPVESPGIKVTLTKSGFLEVSADSLSADDAGTAFQRACVKGNPFLRRSEILNFLLARPVDRFTYLEAFLDLTDIDEIAKKYRDAVDRCESGLTSSRNQLESSLRSFSDRLPQLFRSKASRWGDLEGSCLRYGSEISVLDARENGGWNDLETAGKRARGLSEGDQLEKNRSSLTEIGNLVREFEERHLSKVLPNIEDLHRQCEQQKESTVDAPIADLLSHARLHLEASTAGVCPVCLNGIDREQVLEQLISRLQKLKSYQEAEKRVRSALATWRNALSQFTSICSKVKENFKLNNFSQLVKSQSIPPGLDLLADVDQTENVRLLAQILAIGSDKMLDWMKAVTNATSAKVKNELDALPASSSLGDLRVFASLMEDMGEKRDSLLKLENEATRLAMRTEIAKKISEALRRARQDVARDTLELISSTVAEYYEIIHPPDEPHEATGPPSVKIQRHAKGTAFVQGKFAGREVSDPKWVYSDGHLDTLGICVFLALRRYRGDLCGDSRLMVLDDVILSIDLPHARRIINLLKDKFKDHQIIILTHNGLFAYWCSRLLPGLKRITINAWTLEDGPRLGEYLSAMRLVEESLLDAPPKQIALQLMALMDEWLAECRYAYSLSVPAKPGEQYTISEIWEPFSGTLKKMGRQLNSDFGGVTALLDTLRDLPAIRNALPAHENEFAKEFPRTTMVEIATKCLDLVRGLYCGECCTFAVPIPHRFDPSIIHCDCHTIQYVKSSPGTSRANV